MFDPENVYNDGVIKKISDIKIIENLEPNSGGKWGPGSKYSLPMVFLTPKPFKRDGFVRKKE